jgi:hypothetical protein
MFITGLRVWSSRRHSLIIIASISASTFCLIWGSLVALDIHISLIVQFRAVAVALTFFLVCFFDIRRQSPGLQIQEFFPHYFTCLMQTIAAFPILIVAFGIVFLVLVLISEAIGLGSAVLNTPVYIGVVYGPVAAVYWISKSRWKRYSFTQLPV